MNLALGGVPEWSSDSLEWQPIDRFRCFDTSSKEKNLKSNSSGFDFRRRVLHCNRSSLTHNTRTHVYTYILYIYTIRHIYIYIYTIRQIDLAPIYIPTFYSRCVAWNWLFCGWAIRLANRKENLSDVWSAYVIYLTEIYSSAPTSEDRFWLIVFPYCIAAMVIIKIFQESVGASNA